MCPGVSLLLCSAVFFSNGIKRENNASYIRPRSIGALSLFILKHDAIWLHLDDKYDENMIRPETLGE